MKTSRSANTKQSKQQPQSHKAKPEIRDDLDSLHNSERNKKSAKKKIGDKNSR
jgi:hypothetical protein